MGLKELEALLDLLKDKGVSFYKTKEREVLFESQPGLAPSGRPVSPFRQPEPDANRDVYENPELYGGIVPDFEGSKQ